MNPDPQLWGIELQYKDVHKQLHTAPPATVDGILRAMGAATHAPELGLSAPLVITQGESIDIEGEWILSLEDGSQRRGVRALPRDVELGYHRLCTSDGDRLLIVAPQSAPSFSGVRDWGWALQLYSLRSKQSWGIGDLGDLARFGDLARTNDASFVLINPVHASIPGIPQQSSPYYPSSREFRNPIFIDVSQVPNATSLDGEAIRSAQSLNDDQRIDRDAVWTYKLDALELLWQRFDKSDNAFQHFVQQQGQALRRYATYCVLREKNGILWHQWPALYRHPASSAVEHFASENSDRVQFHQWLQWLVAIQLEKAAQSIPLIEDLAIGVDPAGADAWLWQDAFALDMRVGAPPDEFNQRGQDWGLPPFNPWKLQEFEYEPFIRTIRAALSNAGGVRIDHVMGLFRLYWIPDGMSARHGTYVQYPWKDLLAIVCLEAVRAGSHVVGEDLGTVEPYMRKELRARNIASYKLLWFEEDAPSTYPHSSLAAITTHDLPTIAGLLSGSDLELQAKLGLDPNVESTNAICDRVTEMADLEGLGLDESVDACHRLLATASSALVSVTLEDALRLSERPNYPGTTSEWPNWSVALPVDLDELGLHPGFKATVEVVSSTRAEMAYHDTNGATEDLDPEPEGLP